MAVDTILLRWCKNEVFFVAALAAVAVAVHTKMADASEVPDFHQKGIFSAGARREDAGEGILRRYVK